MSLLFRSLNKSRILLHRSTLNFSKPLAIGFADDKSEEDKPNLYNTLGLKSSATPAEIKQAYYDLTKKYHPDRNEGNDEASNKFREVTEAYEVLGNYGMRKRYDKGLPLSLIKSQKGRSPIVEKEVKYQKFYDSRETKQKFDWQTSEQDEEVKPSRKQILMDQREARADKQLAESKKMEPLLAVFICFLFTLSYYVYGPEF